MAIITVKFKFLTHSTKIKKATYHKAIAIFDENFTQLAIATEKSFNISLLHSVWEATNVNTSSHVKSKKVKENANMKFDCKLKQDANTNDVSTWRLSHGVT